MAEAYDEELPAWSVAAEEVAPVELPGEWPAELGAVADDVLGELEPVPTLSLGTDQLLDPTPHVRRFLNRIGIRRRASRPGPALGRPAPRQPVV